MTARPALPQSSNSAPSSVPIPRIRGRPAGSHSHGHRRNLSTEVSETARLDLVVPHASELDIAAEIAASDGGKPTTTCNVPAIANITQRDYLFYDEMLPLFVVLEILAPLDDSLYEHYLSRLAVSLEVTAIDGRRAQQGHASRAPETVHLLFQTFINEIDNPRIPLGSAHRRLAVWKLHVPLGHPKSPLSNPRVILTCSATLRPAELQKPLLEDEYVTSRQPGGINLLEPLSDDPSLGHIAPRLSALRVSRVIPVTQQTQQTVRPLGYAAKRTFGIFPAINIRLRYSRVQSGSKMTIVACLDLEVTTTSECSVTISSVNISVTGGRAGLVGDSPSTALPITCRPRDDTTFLYKLTQSDSSSNPISPNASHVRNLAVTLQATALVSEDCHPQISTHWTTTVDFAPPPIPHFPTQSGIQRANRPPSLGPTPGATVSSAGGVRPVFQSSQSPAVVFTPPLDSHSFGSPPDSTSLGLTVTFTGPSRVYVGEVFIWSVFVVNRSNRTRKLALVVPPKRKKTGEQKNLPPTPGGEPPEPVVDDSLVYQIHRSLHLDPAELVPLVNDLRIGPLMPSACHAAELRFVPLTTGLLALEGVRVVDLNTNETTDCRELPCIMSVTREQSQV